MQVAVGKALILGLFCVSVAGALQGQKADGAQLPDAPSAAEQPRATPASPRTAVVFHKKAFWTLVAVDAASAVADAQTSWHIENLYPNSREQNSWLYGKRPGLARYYLTDLAVDGGSVLLSYKLLHARRRALRVMGWAVLGAVTAAHTEGWIHNTNQLSNAPPPAKSHH